ncbi:MAG TPA: HAMP domain-containing sensor histidine kinase [Bryobacteraceae bacterium]|jgi:signal transduction histidine kinase|nr:HAMP domain-containing sensor histidine kinase [Bryobacteraceae bacterium]
MAGPVTSRKQKGGSLLLRILVATSLAVTAVFALAGWMVEQYAARVSNRGIEEEVRTSLEAYQALWSTRVHDLTSISRIISSMSDVRAAFMTRDRATIRDTAEQLWSQISVQDANFLVLDPTGAVITSLGGDPDFSVGDALPRLVAPRFPNQVSGYVQHASHLYYVVFTPVYVQSSDGQALLNILLVAFGIDDTLASSLKHSTHGSDFAFVASNRVIASTLPGVTPAILEAGAQSANGLHHVTLNDSDYLSLGADLPDPTGKVIGKLFIIRSAESAQAVLAELQRNVGVFWGLAILVALGLTFLLARRILRPVHRLDRAAEEVIRRNYKYRVPVETNDELGRLATTFNTMCESIQDAREELVRQEQIATIGRLSSSIVHDLRNPLAAVYGGAEMLVDADLTQEQRQRLASSIYVASRRIQELLKELVDVSRSKSHPVETCKLSDIVADALQSASRNATAETAEINTDVPEEIWISGDRDRLQRVFVNLIDNAVDAMPEGGRIEIRARTENGAAVVEVEDSGRGIAEEAWPKLFQPFASYGKKNGLGLGLALSRQTLLDHAGDLWADRSNGGGARFSMRIPLAQS